MLEIAGGILIAAVILVALPYLLVGAYWGIIVAVGLTIVVGGWFALAAVVGQGWALGIISAALVIWLGWSEHQDTNKNNSDATSGKTSGGF